LFFGTLAWNALSRQMFMRFSCILTPLRGGRGAACLSMHRRILVDGYDKIKL
jgi:hypothetical protein